MPLRHRFDFHLINWSLELYIHTFTNFCFGNAKFRFSKGSEGSGGAGTGGESGTEEDEEMPESDPDSDADEDLPLEMEEAPRTAKVRFFLFFFQEYLHTFFYYLH